MIDLDRLRRQVMSNEEADQAAAELRALRREIDECRSVIALHQQNGCGVQLYAEGLRIELDAARGVISAGDACARICSKHGWDEGDDFYRAKAIYDGLTEEGRGHVPG